MQFVFEGMEQKEPVAFMSGTDLVVKLRDGGNIVFRKEGTIYKGELPFDEYLRLAGPKKKFYEGDSVTITF